MQKIITRAEKGTPLTHDEMDSNFSFTSKFKNYSTNDHMISFIEKNGDTLMQSGIDLEKPIFVVHITGYLMKFSVDDYGNSNYDDIPLNNKYAVFMKAEEPQNTLETYEIASQNSSSSLSLSLNDVSLSLDGYYSAFDLNVSLTLFQDISDTGISLKTSINEVIEQEVY